MTTGSATASPSLWHEWLLEEPIDISYHRVPFGLLFKEAVSFTHSWVAALALTVGLPMTHVFLIGQSCSCCAPPSVSSWDLGSILLPSCFNLASISPTFLSGDIKCYSIKLPKSHLAVFALRLFHLDKPIRFLRKLHPYEPRAITQLRLPRLTLVRSLPRPHIAYHLLPSLIFGGVSLAIQLLPFNNGDHGQRPAGLVG